MRLETFQCWGVYIGSDSLSDGSGILAASCVWVNYGTDVKTEFINKKSVIFFSKGGYEHRGTCKCLVCLLVSEYDLQHGV